MQMQVYLENQLKIEMLKNNNYSSIGEFGKMIETKEIATLPKSCKSK